MRTLWLPLLALVALYFVQGLISGLGFGLKFLAQDAGADESDQAIMSIANYPYSFKFIWAGLIDGFHSERIGRRKSWLLPVLLILAASLLYFSFQIDDWLSSLQIVKLTIFMTSCQVLIATSDICVDAWALDLLPHSKRSLQANCNAGGFSFGIFISSGLFLSLTNPEFCSKWFGNAIKKYPNNGDYEFSGALFSHSTVLKLYSLIIFLVLVFILFISLPDGIPTEIKTHKSPCSSIFQSYKYFVSLRRNKILLIWLFILSTCYIGLGPTLDLQNLKLRKLGISLATIGWIKTLSSPIRFLLSILLVKFSINYPLQIWYSSLCALQIIFMAITLLIYLFPLLITQGLETILVVIFSILFEIFKSTLTIGVMSYHASIADPIYGGVYMSLLAAFSNLGKTWPGTMSLSVLSWMDTVNIPRNSTDSNNALEWDNYATVSFISSLIGCIWLLVTRQLIVRYQSKTGEDFRPKKMKMILLAE